jgi:hypothetical protein
LCIVDSAHQRGCSQNQGAKRLAGVQGMTVSSGPGILRAAAGSNLTVPAALVQEAFHRLPGGTEGIQGIMVALQAAE